MLAIVWSNACLTRAPNGIVVRPIADTSPLPLCPCSVPAARSATRADGATAARMRAN